MITLTSHVTVTLPRRMSGCRSADGARCSQLVPLLVRALAGPARVVARIVESAALCLAIIAPAMTGLQPGDTATASVDGEGAPRPGMAGVAGSECTLFDPLFLAAPGLVASLDYRAFFHPPPPLSPLGRPCHGTPLPLHRPSHRTRHFLVA